MPTLEVEADSQAHPRLIQHPPVQPHGHPGRSEAPEIPTVSGRPFAAPVDVLAIPTTDRAEAGIGGEGGVLQVTNAEFIAAVFPVVPEGAYAAVCTKSGDPGKGGWPATRADRTAEHLPEDNNNFVNSSSFYPGRDGSFKALKDQFAACHFLLLDDLGTKVARDRLGDLPPSWLIETSPGNYQGGLILATPVADSAEASRLHNAVIDAGLCDPGAGGPASRWARLPAAANGKPKHADEAGRPFQCRLGRVNTTGVRGRQGGNSRVWRSRPSNLPPSSIACLRSAATSA